MHCKSFVVRVAPPVSAADTDALTAFLGAVDVSAVHSALVAAEKPFWSVLVFFHERKAIAAPEPPLRQEPVGEPPPAEPLTPEEQAVLDQLKIWRRERARQEGVPVYVVAHNATLEHLAREAGRIHTVDDLAGIQRMRAGKAEKYGPELLELLQVAREG
jgi:superfamily II DNA helicase RecQ